MCTKKNFHRLRHKEMHTLFYLSICLEPTLPENRKFNLSVWGKLNKVQRYLHHFWYFVHILRFCLPSLRLYLYFEELGFHYSTLGLEFGEEYLVCTVLCPFWPACFLEAGICLTAICCWCLQSQHGFWHCLHHLCWQRPFVKTMGPLYFPTFSESLLCSSWVTRKH